MNVSLDKNSPFVLIMWGCYLLYTTLIWASSYRLCRRNNEITSADSIYFRMYLFITQKKRLMFHQALRIFILYHFGDLTAAQKHTDQSTKANIDFQSLNIHPHIHDWPRRWHRAHRKLWGFSSQKKRTAASQSSCFSFLIFPLWRSISRCRRSISFLWCSISS